MDSYQAVYDAVRSKISGGSISDAAEAALREAFGHAGFLLQQAAQEHINAGHELQRPSVVFKPKISLDGAAWCVLYGDNLQDGVAGFGDSPSEAMWDFDKNWHKKLSSPQPSLSTEQQNVQKEEV
ncbi:MAG TPA: hypothetical protein VD999_07655 [Vitreimonas sp.]|nr:hypothetical protein [Vitreimonas sp.]